MLQVKLSYVDQGSSGKPPGTQELVERARETAAADDEFTDHSMTYCITHGDSTAYFACQTNDKLERLAFAVQRNLEFGGPPTQFYGITNVFDSGIMTAQTLTKN